MPPRTTRAWHVETATSAFVDGLGPLERLALADGAWRFVAPFPTGLYPGRTRTFTSIVPRAPGPPWRTLRRRCASDSSSRPPSPPGSPSHPIPEAGCPEQPSGHDDRIHRSCQ